MKFYVHLVAWEGEKFLPDFLATFKQAARGHDVTLRVVINGGQDGTQKYLEEHFPDSIAAINPQNIGFSPAHNQLFKETLGVIEPALATDTLIVLANQDLLFSPDFFAALAAVSERHPQAAAFQPKLWRATWGQAGETLRTKELDSTGLKILRGYTFIDRAQGEEDVGQFTEGTVEGVNGALCVIRASAAQAISYPAGEVFDSSFFAYKEDADLSWRFRRAGYRMIFAPAVTAWHYRGLPGRADRGFWVRFFDRLHRSAWRGAYGTRNQFLMLIKNLEWSDVWRHGLTILVVESGRLLFGLLCEPATRRLILRSGPDFKRAWARRVY
jgi:GT2 family glycosyltransferase